VAQRAGGPRLLFEAPKPFGIVRERRGQDLDRDVTAKPWIVRAVDRTHPAGADRADDGVVPEAYARRETHRGAVIIVSCGLGLIGAEAGKRRPDRCAHRPSIIRDNPTMRTVKADRVLLIAALLLVAVKASAADLRITDSRGTEVVVQSAAIDYGGFMASDIVTEGIRLMQGDGSVLIKWTDLESLKVIRRDESVKPPRIELEIVLRNQKKVPAALLRQGRMKLTGKTELGEYSIDLDKVRTITPIK
jgi:hypothetical protein